MVVAIIVATAIGSFIGTIRHNTVLGFIIAVALDLLVGLLLPSTSADNENCHTHVTSQAQSHIGTYSGQPRTAFGTAGFPNGSRSRNACQKQSLAECLHC
jgi:hypothetical protein